ncbi:MAG: peptide-methionine (R)-S-oxide reductase MsrB [Alcanivoracaceae bacterium]
MQRRRFLQHVLLLGAATGLPAVLARAASPVLKLDVSAESWRDKVSDEAWQVLFREATERPGSSPLNHERREGTFICAACYLPLFSSEHKYDSGTGWPSFTRPIDSNHIGTRRDFRLLLSRTEYHCARCGGHQGHVFNDGPPPRRERWCNNGVALRFVPDGDELPALRS